MGVSLRQAAMVGAYVAKQRVKGRKRYPLVVMLEPLYQCNLECPGCGKIQYPMQILKQRMEPEAAFRAVEECGAPVVSIAGGEPLIHPQIHEIAAGLVKRRKFVYLCTNALLLEKKLHLFKPSPYLSFSVHMDGLRERHDHMVAREGTFDIAVRAIKQAKAAGFRVTTNTTLFEGEDPGEVRGLFDYLTELGVDGMMVSPGYSYQKAPDQEHFLQRERTKEMFKEILRGKHKWNFNQSPLFLEFLAGKREYECTPWAMPCYSVFGWQKPCYLMSDGYEPQFVDLMEHTEWDRYGTGRDERCANCMVHCGYEGTALNDSLSGIKGMADTVRLMATGVHT